MSWTLNTLRNRARQTGDSREGEIWPGLSSRPVVLLPVAGKWEWSRFKSSLVSSAVRPHTKQYRNSTSSSVSY